MPALEERNKAVVLRLKDEISSQGRFDVIHEIAVPGFRPKRQGLHNLVQNARDQGFPEPGNQMRAAFPDRVDHVQAILAEGDRVGMLWRMTATHLGNLCGIPPTGRSIDVHAAGFFRLENGLIAEATFMADEAGLLRQLGAPLPRRKDGHLYRPAPTNAGEEPRAVLDRLEKDSSKAVAVRSRIDTNADIRTPDYVHKRSGKHPMDDPAFPDRADRIEGLIAESDTVWMQLRLAGTHKGSFFGHPATGRRVEMSEVGILKLRDGKLAEGWYFGDELGLLLQMDATHLLL